MKKKKVQDEKLNISQKELVRVYRRLHSRLAKEVRSLQKQDQLLKGKDKGLHRKLLEVKKELYAYIRLMELCQSLSKDNGDMQELIGAISVTTLTVDGRPN